MSKLSSHGKARFAIEFDNGVRLSFIWGAMTYSDNHDKDWIAPHALSDDLKALGMGPEPDRISSTTVEIMAFGPAEFTEFFEEKYNGNPAMYVPVHKIPSIMQRAKSYKASPLT